MCAGSSPALPTNKNFKERDGIMDRDIEKIAKILYKVIVNTTDVKMFNSITADELNFLEDIIDN